VIKLTLKGFLIYVNYMKYWVLFGLKTLTISMIVATTINNSLLLAQPKSNAQNQTIQGNSGGPIDSKNCGFVATTPSYTLSLPDRLDYLRMFVEVNGGQPTLLVIGPKQEDSYCVLGDLSAGLNPEISGVWEAGTYSVYVGDRSGEQHQFTLSISTDPN
jgi:hypothetical protein